MKPKKKTNYPGVRILELLVARGYSGIKEQNNGNLKVGVWFYEALDNG